MGSRKKNGLEFVAKYESIDMDDDDKSSGTEDLAGQTVNILGLGLNYWPIKEVRLSVNGFVFDIDRPVTSATADDPFNNGDSAWAVVWGIGLTPVSWRVKLWGDVCRFNCFAHR